MVNLDYRVFAALLDQIQLMTTLEQKENLVFLELKGFKVRSTRGARFVAVSPNIKTVFTLLTKRQCSLSGFFFSPLGLPGAIGYAGENGLPGVKGGLGLTGFPGVRGKKGFNGDQGLFGLRGPDGVFGKKGEHKEKHCPLIVTFISLIDGKIRDISLKLKFGCPSLKQK